MKPKFGSIKQFKATPPPPETLKHLKIFASIEEWNAEHEERAAIHEFDGQLPRAEAERRAAEECQHCGKAAELGTIFRVDYGYNLSVCAACAGELRGQGWTDAVV